MTVIVASSIATSNVFGYILNIAGQPVEGVTVTAKLVDIPTFIQLPADSYGIPVDPISVKTDEDGYFEIALVRQISVDILIPSINFRRTIEVPTSSTNLFSIE